MAPPVQAQADQITVPQKIQVPEIDKLLERDGYLKLHESEIRRRYLYLIVLNLFSMTFLLDNVLFYGLLSKCIMYQFLFLHDVSCILQLSQGMESLTN